jgi:hypothetical protein
MTLKRTCQSSGSVTAKSVAKGMQRRCPDQHIKGMPLFANLPSQVNLALEVLLAFLSQLHLAIMNLHPVHKGLLTEGDCQFQPL